MVDQAQPPRYLPHMQQPGVLHMGLSRIAPQNWIETDDALGEYHRHKRELARRDFSAVFAESGDCVAAQGELDERLEAHLLADHGGEYWRDPAAIHSVRGGFSVADEVGPPLWRASLLVADDLLLMLPRKGAYCLAAASLCSPSHWRLAEKIGRPMHEVHDPVPGIHDDLSGRIERFFEHLRPEAPVQRFNWSLQWNDSLFCPGRTSGESGELFYRTERQTLTRLPDSGAIAFTIRVYRHPLRSLAAVPGALEALRGAILAAPEPLLEYKSFASFLPALEDLIIDAAPEQRSA